MEETPHLRVAPPLAQDPGLNAIWALGQAEGHVSAMFTMLRSELKKNGYTTRAEELIDRLQRSHERVVELLQGSFPTE